MRKPTILLSVLLLTAVAAAPASAETLLAQPGLVSTEWVAEHLDHPDLRIIDARDSMGPYLQGHLPRAIYLNTETVRISEGGVPAVLLAPEQLAETFGRIGIGHQHTVVVYSSGREAFAHAAYIAYLLELLGHQAIGVMDGGSEKWAAEERPLARDFPGHELASFTPKFDPTLIRSAGDVMRAIEGNEAVLLDARPPAAFAAGHIPTARSFFLFDTINGTDVTTWKSPAELRTLAAEAGADGKKPIITYCTSGRQSAQIWFSLRHVAGLPEVSSYDGSWIDWTAKGLVQEK
jgi:thiosulfate/3-mercaptopyruvate sulfurtransferase